MNHPCFTCTRNHKLYGTDWIVLVHSMRTLLLMAFTGKVSKSKVLLVCATSPHEAPSFLALSFSQSIRSAGDGSVFCQFFYQSCKNRTFLHSAPASRRASTPTFGIVVLSAQSNGLLTRSWWEVLLQKETQQSLTHYKDPIGELFSPLILMHQLLTP